MRIPSPSTGTLVLILALAACGTSDIVADSDPFDFFGDLAVTDAVADPFADRVVADPTVDGVYVVAGPVRTGRVLLGHHCEVFVRAAGTTWNFGIGGGGSSILERFQGFLPPKYGGEGAQVGSDTVVYRVTCPLAPAVALERLQGIHATSQPAPYNAAKLNSNTYVHFLLDAIGGTLTPFVLGPDGHPTYPTEDEEEALSRPVRTARGTVVPTTVPHAVPGWDRYVPGHYELRDIIRDGAAAAASAAPTNHFLE